MKKFALLFSFLIFGIATFGQTSVQGKVVDISGNGLPYVNVVFQNSSTGTNADENGNFILKSSKKHNAIKVSFLGYKTEILPLDAANVTGLKIILEEETSNLDAVKIVQGKTSKKNNPALDILKKIRENRRKNGTKAFQQYEYKKYEKLEFELVGIDSSSIRNPLLKGMEFIFDYADTNAVSGKTYLPVFINESVSKIYGDNELDKEKTVLLGNKNSGFEQNQNLIAAVNQVYDNYDIYSDYFKIYDKSFVSPLGKTGIHNYNYVLTDTAFVDKKWCYQVMFYPRRKNELTFKGDFWVNDTTWAVKKITMETAPGININWVRQMSIEQEFEVLNDSVFLLTKDNFSADFSFEKNEDARGMLAHRSTFYTDYNFDVIKAENFYSENLNDFDPLVYEKEENFWQQNRTENLDEQEEGVYEMLDSLTLVKSFKRLYDLASIAESRYIEFRGWDLGPVTSFFGYNQIEGFRTRLGGRTYFGQHDPWRVEAYLAYGFGDNKFKHGILGKLMLDKKSRLVLSAGNRRDIEQLGASLTNQTDVLGRSLASSALLNVGDNDKLSWLELSVVSLDIEPLRNLNFRLSGSHRKMQSASPNFSLAYFTDDNFNITEEVINQSEISTQVSFTPGRLTSGFGVERNVLNNEEFPTFFLNYSVGLKDVINSDFNYKKIQFFYDQPLLIGGFGRANASLEAGKTFGEVPLGLLSVVPGNQTYFSIYNSFPALNFYEFVTDTYISAHFRHNFNGRLFSRIPVLRKLNLRELVGIRGVWGAISEENIQLDASGLELNAPNFQPYWETSLGVGNILKFITIEGHFRGNYFQNPDARRFALTFSLGFDF